MLNGWHDGQRSGSGTVVWKSRERLAAGEIDYEEFMNIVASSAPSVGHCKHHGHRLDDEFAGRSARHVAARLRRDPCALSRARPDRLRHRDGASSTWSGRI